MPPKTPTGEEFRWMKNIVYGIQGFSLILFIVFAVLLYNVLTGHPHLPKYSLVPFGFGTITFLIVFLLGNLVSSELQKAEKDTKDKSE